MTNPFTTPDKVAQTYSTITKPVEEPVVQGSYKKSPYPTFFASIGEKFEGTMQDHSSNGQAPEGSVPVAESSEEEDDEKFDLASDAMPMRRIPESDENLTHARADISKKHLGNTGVQTYVDDSTAINQSLHAAHSGKKLDAFARSKFENGNVHEHIQNIDKVLDDSTTSGSMTVYSGIHIDPAVHFKPDAEGKIPDSVIIHHPAYLSTSSNPMVAGAFAPAIESHTGKPLDQTVHALRNPLDGTLGNKLDTPTAHRHVLKLHLPDSTKAVSVWKKFTGGDVWAPNATEKEILLHRGHDIRIHRNPSVGPSTTNGAVVWHAEVVGHNPMPLDHIKKAIT